MRVTKFSLPVAFAVFLAAPQIRAEPGGGSFENQVRNRIVSIQVTLEDGGTSCAVGTLLTSTLVLTALHVVHPEFDGSSAAKSFTVTSATGNKQLVTTGGVSPPSPSERQQDVDVGLLSLPKAFDDIDTSDQIFARERDQDLPDSTGKVIGSQCGSAPQAVDADIRGTRGARWVADHKLAPGYSGSPVISTRYRRIVAVYSGVARAAQEAYLAPLSNGDVQSLLNDQDIDLPPATVDATRWPLAKHALLVEGSIIGQVGNGPAGMVALRPAMDFEFALSREHHWSIGAEVGGSVLGFLHSPEEYLSPVDGSTLSSNPGQGGIAVRVDAGVLVRARRLDFVSYAAVLGARLGHVFRSVPHGDSISSATYGGFLSGRMQLGSAFYLLLVAGVDHWPATEFRYTGFGDEVQAAGSTLAVSGAFGLGACLGSW